MRLTPFFKLLLPFALGILVAIFTKDEHLRLWLRLTFTFLIFWGGSLFIKSLKWQVHVLFASSVFMFWFCCGGALLIWNRGDLKPDFFDKLKQREGYVLRVNDVLIKKERGFKTTADVVAVISNGRKIPSSGEVSVFISGDKQKAVPVYGDELVTRQMPVLLAAPKNVEEFDYRKYMALNNIGHQMFLREGDWANTGKNSGYKIFSHIYAFRETLSGYMDELFAEKDSRGVGKALILGETNELSPHLISAYAGTGTLHVLSVSGLHVGIIFFALGLLTAGMKRKRWLRIVRVVFLLCCLFGYAIITGLSSSILRSVVMFTFILIGDQMKRGKNIVNTIYVSAFLLLAYYPFYIAQVGFQLSYIALLGIVWLQKPICNLIDVPEKGWKWWLPRKTWELTSVSLAAQIATFPLGLLYFNQFPLYFLFSNLFIIPLSSIILGLGCVFLLLKVSFSFIASASCFQAIPAFEGFGFRKFVEGLNYLIEKMNALPYARLEGTYLREWECALIYGMILLFGFAFIYKQKFLLKLGFVTLLFFYVSRSVLRYESYHHNGITVYQVPKHKHVFSIKSGEKLYLVGDSSFVYNPDMIKYYIFRYANKNFISPKNVIPFEYSQNLQLTDGKFDYRNGIYKDENGSVKVK